MKKVVNILIWIGISAWFLVILGFVSGAADQVLCNRIEVILSDSIQYKFVTRSDIRSMLEVTDGKLQGYPIAEINTGKLEKALEQSAYISNAEVSKDISGRLEVRIEQRAPLVRIMPDDGEGFYLDAEGVVLPLSVHYTPLILIASGHIEHPGKSGKPGKQLQEILRFSNYLSDHPFWKDQIVQIYVNNLGEYELIPRVGAHQILLGSMEKWEKKLRNLELLYTQGLPIYGWNSYRTINLKYTNQVICTKR